MSPRELMPLGDDLKRCEKIIARAKESMGNARLAAGSGFLEIRDGYCTHVKDSKGNPKKGLYHERGYTRFDTYCQMQWGESVSDVNRVISAVGTRAEIAEKVTPIGVTLPVNEAQLRELARAEEPAEAWVSVVEEHGAENVTATKIRDHVQASNGTLVVPVEPVAPRPVRYLDSSLDISNGERVDIRRVDDEGELTVLTNPDVNGFSGSTVVYLDEMQLRALATLALMIAEEIRRAS